MKECELGVQTRFRILLLGGSKTDEVTLGGSRVREVSLGGSRAQQVVLGGSRARRGPLGGSRALGRRSPRSGGTGGGCGSPQEVRVCNRHACNKGQLCLN